jgi:hypothetical protein
VTSEAARRGALEALDRILNRGGDADDVVREAVAVLGRLFPYVGISFVEAGELVAGPSAGERSGAVRTWPVSFEGTRVAELAAAAGDEDEPLLARVATLISAYCLVAWDTGGRAWDP